jgi:hypothetical protein
MALRDPEIPNHRERASLQLMTHGNWVALKDLYPAGKGTVASLVSKGWIEADPNTSGIRQFHITQTGRTALSAKIR